MLEDIYPRLMCEIIPRGLTDIDAQRVIDTHNEGREANAAYGKLLKSVYKANPGADIGLKLGQFLLPSKLCDFSRVLMTSENLQTALSLVERLYYVQGACYHPFTSRKGSKVYISLLFPCKTQLPEVQRRFCAETAFSYLVNGIRESVATDFRPTKVLFDFPAPAYQNEYTPLFGDSLSFNQNLNMIEFEDHYMSGKLSAYNTTLHQMYLKRYLDFARHHERNSSFEYKAISYLLLHHPETMSSENLAARLNISVRGLQKRLSKSGQSFSGIANLCRRELTKVYLIQQQQNLDYTAERLGFQSNSGFRRFFKAEFNATPAEYLEHCQNALATE
ncbi:MAG: hypothetical protein C9356_01670 [Oleiphilus sp.]|nr:MAG: hypothetical protein C9356_01670 [Oleiphilus sp.]